MIDQQNLPLALMGAVGALIVGLFLSLLRALVVEEGIWRSSRLSADDYASLAENEETSAPTTGSSTRRTGSTNSGAA